jgi:catechol 2,3-dioxygenase-like lactoylglutathione lyase family enzyme
LFDHVTLRVPDLAAADQRYEAVLATLGIDRSSRTGSFAVWTNFALTETDDEHPVTKHLHVAFVAPSREAIHDFWQAGVDAGFRDDGPPGPRPHYSADYYATFLRDAGDNRIEAVHRDVKRPAGVIEHLAIRVADLAAATAFYRTISAAARFDLRHESANRSTFAGPSGGAFSLVPGTPTENLHMAFPATDDGVARFYDDAIAAGYRGNGEPGERPQYHAGYYAAYLLDPDGNNIEAVNHHRSPAPA